MGRCNEMPSHLIHIRAGHETFQKSFYNVQNYIQHQNHGKNCLCEENTIRLAGLVLCRSEHQHQVLLLYWMRGLDIVSL